MVSEKLTRNLESIINAVENGNIEYQEVLKNLEEETRKIESS